MMKTANLMHKLIYINEVGKHVEIESDICGKSLHGKSVIKIYRNKN